jgi:pilus assembly protein CpaC
VVRLREILALLALAACSSLLSFRTARGAEPMTPTSPAQPGGPSATAGQPAQDAAAQPPAGANPSLAKLVVTVGKSLIIDSPLDIKRLSVANGDLAEAVAVNPREVLINGKTPGETSLIVWQQNGARLLYDLTVRMSNLKLDAARQQIARDFPSEEINLTFENDTAFVRGTVHDLTAAERVMSIAATLGKTVNLLRVDVPAVEQQVVLKVKFANVDRTASMQLGANFFNNSFNQQTQIGTGATISSDNGHTFNLGSAVNLFLQRPDLNLAAAITALQNKNVLEMLAEPNLLAISGQQASFLAGGEFPFPMVQPSSGGGSSISIMWREYGIRLNFLPNVTPRGTIRLKVAPEVSSLDYTNSVSIQGFTIPGLSERRVQTEVELDSGQSFVIAGLLDNQATESLSKVPGISSIPVLGKLFQSKQMNRSNSELLVIITPEIVRPIPAGQAAPELKFPTKWMPANSGIPMAQPGLDKTGPVPVKPPMDSVPVEFLMPKQGPPPAGANPVFQMVPVPAAPAAPPNPNAGITPAAMPAPGGSGK